jgi:hypothetical protein
MNRTNVGTKTGIAHTDRLQEPVTNTQLNVEWNTRAIGDASRNGSLREMHYADQRRQSAVLGIWQRNTVIVHGE